MGDPPPKKKSGKYFSGKCSAKAYSQGGAEGGDSLPLDAQQYIFNIKCASFLYFLPRTLLRRLTTVRSTPKRNASSRQIPGFAYGRGMWGREGICPSPKNIFFRANIMQIRKLCYFLRRWGWQIPCKIRAFC